MKRLASVLTVLLLAACDGGPGTDARLLARQQAVDPPRLWRIDTLDAANRVRGVRFVCADTPLSQTFARVQAVVEDTPCATISGPVARPGFSTLRCVAQGRAYVISAETQGDTASDFRLAVTVTPLNRGLGAGRQMRRFQRLGACPATWRLGDQADAVR